jgi:hypothetical protein
MFPRRNRDRVTVPPYFRNVLLCAAASLFALCCQRAIAQAKGDANDTAAKAAAASTPSSAPLSLQQYEAELDRASVAVREASEALQGDSGNQGTTAPSVTLPVAWVVEVDSQRYEIPTDWLNTALNVPEKDANVRRQRLADAAARLALLRAEAGKLGTGQDVASGTSARAHLDEILRRREFRRIDQQKSWIAELWERILEWLLRLLARIFGSAERAGAVKNIILYGAICVAFVLLAWTVVRALRTLARSEAALRLTGAPPAGKTWNQWAREALAAAGHGDYRAAIHAAYWAGVYRLADLGVWQLDRSLTPREYLRLLRQPARASTMQAAAVTLPDLETRALRADSLGALTRTLEAVWYAEEPATQEDFRAAVEQLENLGCRFPSNPRTASS